MTPLGRWVMVLGLLGVCLLPLQAQGHEELPALLGDVGLDQRLQAQIPLKSIWHDETGKAVQLGQYFGSKPVILVLSYYHCARLCPLVLDGLLKSVQHVTFTIGEQFDIVTVSIDPRDTPAVAAATKARYVERYGRPGAAAGWHFLTGEPEVIQDLAHAVGFRYVYDPSRDQFAHASGLMLATPQGKLARYFYGIAYTPRDLRLGLVEAAAGTIGSPVDQLLLFCYHYDPQTGQYSLIIQRVVRIAGVVTVLALGMLMGVLLRREQHRPPNTTSEIEAWRHDA